MSPIQCQCPVCGTELRLSPMASGRRVRCKMCDAVFQVPPENSEAPPKPRNRTSIQGAVDDPDEGDMLELSNRPTLRNTTQAYRHRPNRGALRSEISHCGTLPRELLPLSRS